MHLKHSQHIYSSIYKKFPKPFCHLTFSVLSQNTHNMSYRPNNQGGGRRGSGGRGGRGGVGGGRGGGGGRGEQRWWDPVWRAERLRQVRAENPVEVFDENEWWSKLEEMKGGNENEIIVKRNFGRDGQQAMSDIAYQLGLYL
ncbi:hypothetical protein IFM89_005968 [Coptis chinensis]|uniref:Uncharacterized protein n=1 Tax=Coptis chinensis TaxID=261450 RepID=A0A835LIC7_9MAGN|nr:hypothetical protein IFM89_005968 [Coptis chinensis]